MHGIVSGQFGCLIFAEVTRRCWGGPIFCSFQLFLLTAGQTGQTMTNPIKSCQMNLCRAPRETVSKFNGIHLHWSMVHGHPVIPPWLRSLPSEALQHPFVTKRTVAGRVSGGGFHAQGAQLSYSRSAAWRDLGSRPCNLEVILDLLATPCIIDSVLAGLKKY